MDRPTAVRRSNNLSWAVSKCRDRRLWVFYGDNTKPLFVIGRKMDGAILNGGKANPGRGMKSRGNSSLFCRSRRHNLFYRCKVLNFPFRSCNMNYSRSPFLPHFYNNFRYLHKQKRCLSVLPQKQASRQRVAIWKSKISYLSITSFYLILFLAALPPVFGRRSRQKTIYFILILLCLVLYYLFFVLFLLR